MKLDKPIKLFLHSLIFSALFATVGFSQSIGGGGGIGQPISGGLGGLINTKVFSKITQPNTKTKSKTVVKTPVRSTTTVAGKTVKTSRTTGRIKPAPVEAEYNPLVFKPVANTGLDLEIARSFTQNKAEQDLFVSIFQTVKPAYDAEAAKKGKKNDVAMAVTFFIATCLTVYHDSPEPTDAAFDSLYQALADSLIENGNMAALSNREKQDINDRLVYISGFVLAGYMSGKQENNAETKNAFKLLSGVCLQSLMQIDPNSLKFSKNGLQKI